MSGKKEENPLPQAIIISEQQIGQTQKPNDMTINAKNESKSQDITDSEKPLKKDLMTILVTVSAAFLALAPVLLILQPISADDSSADKFFSTISLIAFAISFVVGLFTIAKGVDWFKQPEEKKQQAAWTLIRWQTMLFTGGSLFVLVLVLFKRFGWTI
jgi:VIT1/CCC1 family predicted Fe2+/Mn2+ transporter